MTGRAVHFELPFDDKERAKRFYGNVFRWELEEMAELDYLGVSTGPTGEAGPTEPGYIGGGMTSRSGPNTAPVVVIDTDDIDATLQRVTEQGGEVVADKSPVGEMGFAAYFKDSEGNVVGLWQTA